MASSYEYKDHASEILKGLDELRADNTFCDGILQASDGQTFQVHRNFLAAASPYFKAMFVGGFKEAKTETPIALPTITSVGLRCVLDCLYSGKMELNCEIVYDVLPAAHMLQLTNILGSCVDFLIREMSADSCIRNVELAEEYGLHEVASAAHSYILSNFIAVSETKEFNEMSNDELCKYLKEDTVKGKEIEIYRVVKQWLDYKPNRRENLSEVMSLINFKAISADLLADEVMQDEALMANRDCFQMAVHAMKYHSNKYMQPFNLQGTLRGQDRLVMLTPEVAGDGGFAEIDIYKKCDIVYESLQETVLNYENTPFKSKLAAGSLCVVTLNNFLYLFATDSDTFTTVTKRFDGTSGVWMDLASVPRQAAIGSSVARLSDTIVLTGGRLITEQSTDELSETSEMSDSTLCYKISLNDWIRGSSCPTKVVFHASCAQQDHVYLVGGYIPEIGDGSVVQLSNRLYAYDIKADVWLSKAQMNHCRAETVLEAVDDKLCVLGGSSFYMNREQVPSIEMYDILHNQWTILENEPGFPFDAAGSFVDEGNIFLLGGYSNEMDHSDIHVFDYKTKSLRKLKQRLRCDVCRIGCGVLKM